MMAWHGFAATKKTSEAHTLEKARMHGRLIRNNDGLAWFCCKFSTISVHIS
jgi:hypothetical protein